jgi:hypothetical protein
VLLVVEFLDFSGDLPRCDTFKLLALADRLERRGRARWARLLDSKGPGTPAGYTA